jgi:hypothetical protein
VEIDLVQEIPSRIILRHSKPDESELEAIRAISAALLHIAEAIHRIEADARRAAASSN